MFPLYLPPLTHDTIRKILTDPKNALVKQYQKLFSMENIALSFTDDALTYIVGKAMDSKLGARGLRSICEAIMTDAMFDFTSESEASELLIDETYAREKFEKSKLSRLKVA